MKLHILGASGSGVTTLGNALAHYLDIPYFDSDNYFWLPTVPPFSQRRDAAERNAMISTELAKQDSWVFGGSVVNWGENVFPVFDLIVFLWIPAPVRMQRLRAREQQRYGEALETDPVLRKSHDAFMQWAADYDEQTGVANRTFDVHRKWLSEQSVPVLEIAGDVSIEERMDKVLAWWNMHHK
ncbi:adenylate kinase [Chitinophaga sp. Cy-1792]|uniref:adenylate kinase n=1 Tax=Chitinophaga sp. Cy-1792 TaxID=2608339 RepID=UPI00141D7E39|nr:adenylate kinase [Chitinophaga sp. Cy-1792]NIG53378.1 adenylate kinase [Chitinophaga sp. Cy-1792]